MSWRVEHIAHRARVITDNDYSGDPDGLVQLAQHLLSPSVDVRFVIGSHLRAGDPWASGALDTADTAALAAQRIVELTDRRDVPVIAGSNTAMGAPDVPVDSAAVDMIVAEAMRDDTDLPLFVVCGAGLTEIASAWLAEPGIAARLTLVWIGGREHDDLASPPPGAGDMEYNLHIDPIAGQVVFNDSDLVIWQVPRDMYRTVMASRAELLVRMRPHGELGRHLFDSLGNVAELAASKGVDVGEIYVLGDSPLVLLTALWTGFEPTPASSTYVERPCPRIAASGRYEPNPTGRPLRIYTRLDSRLLLEDLYAKLELHSGAS